METNNQIQIGMPDQSEQATPPKTDHSRHENREHFENLVSKFAESFVFYRFHDFDTMSNSKLHVAYILNLRDILSRWHAILKGSTNR